MAEETVNKLPGTAPLNELTDQLHERRSKAKLGGGLAKIEAQQQWLDQAKAGLDEFGR